MSLTGAEPAELDVAVASEPTDEVGGDFSDVIATAHGWLVAIGDVCGKGVEAAGLAALARHTVHAAGLRDPDPRQVLGVLHDALVDHDPTKGFCTALCAHLRTDTDPVQLEIASGGHPPAFIRRAGGDLESLEGGGMLLGLFDDAQITESAVALAGDDIVLLYTDGLTEARRGGDHMTILAVKVSA